jgi:hypothetical protein
MASTPKTEIDKKSNGENAMTCAHDDAELYVWLIWSQKYGPSFVRALAEAAFGADIPHYLLLRPVLVQLKREYPMTD